MVKFGTCSWKYDSWKGIVYPVSGKFNYLAEYSRHFDSVEIDQWFWSLFDKVVLPLPDVVDNYAASVPDDFLFTIKLPNSLSLTHYYKTDQKNPHFLSIDLFEQFLSSIEPMLSKTGMLILQFEYLNKQKMPSLQHFTEYLCGFFESLPKDSPPVGIEIRNPNYLNESWFRFLANNNISNVFLEGYFMPPVTETYRKYGSHMKGIPIIRLHGPDRSGIEQISGSEWSKIYIDRENSLTAIAQMINELQEKSEFVFVNVNNHYEGSAPLTINRLKEKLL
jgi:uncharacterized protein YecE (DUF72 family)